MGDHNPRIKDLLHSNDITFPEPEHRVSCCEKINKYIARIFHFPFLQLPPICFYRNEGEHDDSHPNQLPPLRVEELVNFDSKTTKVLYNRILERRKHILENKDLFLHQDVDLAKFPGWGNNDVIRMRSTFRIFDATRDGILDFSEVNCVLSEFGDRTAYQLRKRYYYNFADEFGTFGFEEFLKFFYRLTMQPVDPEYQSLAATLKKIDHNMEIRCKLDTLSQLQGGLF